MPKGTSYKSSHTKGGKQGKKRIRLQKRIAMGKKK